MPDNNFSKPSVTQLRKVLYNQWNTEENWKEQLSSVLHSDVGQLLTAIKFRLSNAGTALERNAGEDEVKEHLDSIGAMTDEAIEHIRRIMKILRSEVLEHFGLPDALEWKLDRIREQKGIRISFHWELSPAEEVTRVEKTLFTVFVFLIDQIAEHRQIRSIEVDAGASKGQIQIVVKVTGSEVDIFTGSPEFKQLAVELSERLSCHGGNFSLQSTGANEAQFFLDIPLD